MEFPVRCFTCGAVVGHLYEQYKNAKDKKPDVVLDELGVDRYCCRRMFLGHVDIGKRPPLPEGVRARSFSFYNNQPSIETILLKYFRADIYCEGWERTE